MLIHDAARPFVPHGVISHVIAYLDRHPGVIPGLPIVDTLKRTEANIVLGTADRTGLWAAQTPQGFRFPLIREAHALAANERGVEFTDDASVAEWAGIEVAVIPGATANRKITTADDLREADERMREMTQAFEPRIGQGFDVHAFEPGDGVTLCGVFIPHAHKLSGHSDADAALHALTDAILGAIGEGDIGVHFPPSDARWKGAEFDHLPQPCARVSETARRRGGQRRHHHRRRSAEDFAARSGDEAEAGRDAGGCARTAWRSRRRRARRWASPAAAKGLPRSPPASSSCRRHMGKIDREISLLAREALDACRDGGLKVATVESCTGGLVAAVLTDVAGSSAVVERGLVTYSNRAKTDLVGVPEAMLVQYGAVSEHGGAHDGGGRAGSFARRYRGRASPASPGRTAGRRKSPSDSSTSPAPGAAFPPSICGCFTEQSAAATKSAPAPFAPPCNDPRTGPRRRDRRVRA